MAKLLITFAFTIDNPFQIKVKHFLGLAESRDEVGITQKPQKDPLAFSSKFGLTAGFNVRGYSSAKVC
jgi:hypothetical protein